MCFCSVDDRGTQTQELTMVNLVGNVDMPNVCHSCSSHTA